MPIYTVSEEFTWVMTQKQAHQVPKSRGHAEEQPVNTRMIPITNYEVYEIVPVTVFGLCTDEPALRRDPLAFLAAANDFAFHQECDSRRSWDTAPSAPLLWTFASVYSVP